MFGAELLQTLSPHLLPAVLVAECERLGGGEAGLYLMDIDGSCLLLSAGSDRLPDRMAVGQAIGPEMPLSDLPALQAAVASHVPNANALPLVVRDRAVALLVTTGTIDGDLRAFLGEAALALELAAGYTDVVHAARRRKPILACAEVQQDLLPPRIVAVDGAQLAGSVLPGYNVAGDVFDYATNADGTWIAVGDAMGKGNRAAACSALAVGAVRAVRRNGGDLADTAVTLDAVIAEAFDGTSFLTALLVHWHGPTMTLGWISCGHPTPLIVHADGACALLAGTVAYPLGTGLGCPPLSRHDSTLAPGDLAILYSDGVSERHLPDGTLFGVDGIVKAAADTGARSAAHTLRRIQDALLTASSEPLRDDATLVVLKLDA